MFPETICGHETGSFAHRTMTIRLPSIARRVKAEQDWPADITASLNALAEDLPDGRIRSLFDVDAPDWQAWDKALAPFLGRSWLQAPWLLAEGYFFRRLLEASGYYKPGSGYGVDPYTVQKSLGIREAAEFLPSIARQADAVIQIGERGNLPGPSALAALFLRSTWGNQVDLSLWPAGEQSSRPESPGLADDRLLINASMCAGQYLSSMAGKAHQVDLLIDNGGLELANDLALTWVILQANLASAVRLHLKAHPTYVSDATIADVYSLIREFSETSEPAAHRLAFELRSYQEDGRLLLQADYFWTLPHSYKEHPQAFHAALASGQKFPLALLISKGDLNYRRMVGDWHWDVETPLATALDYPAMPVLLLRVLKSDALLGIPVGLAERQNHAHPGWRTDGRFAVVQFIDRAGLKFYPP